MNNPAVPIRIQSIQPTIFFRSSSERLYQKVLLSIDASQEVLNVSVLIEWQAHQDQTTIEKILEGKQIYPVLIPDIQEKTEVTVTLIHQGMMLDKIKVKWKPIRHWEIHLVHGSHHDLGYTDLPSNIFREHAAFIDQVLDICDATDEWDDDSRFRYLIEQAWSILYYLQNCSETQAARLVKRIKEKRVEVTALLGNETTELCNQEELIRLLYPAFRLRRKYGIDIVSAELNDIPGVAWGLVSVLAGSGIRYFAPALPDYYGWGRKVRPWWDEKAVLPRDCAGAFWWEGPDQEKVLFWHEGGSIGWTSMWSYEQAQTDLTDKLAALVEKDYPFSLLRIKFHSGHRDNSPPDSRLSYIARQWNEEWAYPRLIVSTNQAFFQQLEQKYGETLPTLRGDLPNTDYHVGAASTARETAINRQAHDLILTSEKFAACAAMLTTTPYPAETLAEAYDSMLMFDEHTWGMAHPVGPAQDACWSQKAQFAYRAQALAQDVLVKSINLIADQINLVNEGFHIIVFNPLTFKNTHPVTLQAVPDSPCSHPMYWLYPLETEQDKNPILVAGAAIGRDLVSLPMGLIHSTFQIIDTSTGNPVAHQIRKLDSWSPQPHAANRYALSQVDPVSVDVLNYSEAQRFEILFNAEDVPPLGYKTYWIKRESDNLPENQTSLNSTISNQPDLPLSKRIRAEAKYSLENNFYRILIDPGTGAITSILDKDLNFELVDSTASFQMNQLVVRMPKSGQVFTPKGAAISGGESGPVLDSRLIKSFCLGCPQIVQEIILPHGVKRIDFHTRILRDSYVPLEIITAFPFASEQPDFLYEGNYSSIRPVLDQLPGTNTDSYTIQHWLRMQDTLRQITFCSLDAAVVYLGKMWSGSVSQAHLASLPQDMGRSFIRNPNQFEKGHIFSLMMMNNFRTNFQPVQTGDVLFRYSITSAPPSSQPDWQFGWQMSQPMQAVITNKKQSGNLPPVESFLQINEPDIHLLTMKAAEDGNGLILRFSGMGGNSSAANITLPYYTIKKAVITNLVEDQAFDLPFGHHRMKVLLPSGKITTVRCEGKVFPPVINGLKF